MEDITTLRTQLDEINRELVEVLARRFVVTERVGRYKAEKGLPVVDVEREREMLLEIERMAEEAGLSEEYAKRIFRVIVDCVCDQHRRNGVNS